MISLFLPFYFLLAVLSVFSYGFKDPNLELTLSPVIKTLIQPLYYLVYYERSWAAIIFFLFVLFLFGIYLFLLKNPPKKIAWIIVVGGIILSFSYPALTHDLFNYITTAKVTFTYHENPYVVMPIEIPNEPYLAFTRAANKVALYGPVWIAITAIPHFLGNNNIWQTIVMFKLVTLFFYFVYAYTVFRITKSIKNTIFFALNPLVVIETLVCGHNDIVMMTLCVLGILFLYKKKLLERCLGVLLFIFSWFIKGTTALLTPLLLIRKISFDRLLIYSYIVLALVFFIAAPIREELYPWYGVWLVCIASLMDMKKNAFIISFTIVLSFVLELRHLPYMWMGYYEGPGPLFRFLVTIIPVGLYLLYSGIRSLSKTHT